MIEENHISVTRTARYYSHGSPSDATEQVWIVLHGYGFLASFFLRWFSSLDAEKNYVVAPEALNRFYMAGYDGRVGATWMTKEDRLSDIQDYVEYLDTLYEKLLAQFDRKKIIVNVLGFSQGAATVSRWISQGKSKPDNFVLWAGIFPPDIDFKKSGPIFDNLNLYVVMGDQDEFVSAERIEKERALLAEEGVSYDFIPYEGGHKVTTEVLNQLVAKLNSNTSRLQD